MLFEKSNLNFIEAFLSVVNSYPEATAFEIEGTGISYTYQECLLKMELWKGYFETLNLKQGDKVLLLLSEGIDFIISFYALASIGAVSACIDNKMTDFELNQILEDFKPLGIIVSNDSFSSRKELLLADKLTKFILVTDMEKEVDKSPCTNPRVLSISSLPKITKKLKPPDNNPVISCHYTYKGLGYPLQVRHRYDEYSIYLEKLGIMYPQKPGAVHLVCLPFYPIYGITTSVLFPLTYGCKLLQVEMSQQKNILRLLKSHNVSFACLVPALLKKLVLEAKLQGDKDEGQFNPGLLITSGGSYLEEAILREILNLLNVKVYQGYGLTETLPITFNYPGKVQYGNMGAPLMNDPGIAIIDCFGNEVLDGSIGEIAIKDCLTMADGYYGKEDETRQFFRNGYFYTGDIGFMDKDNFLHYIGRKYPFTKIVSKMVDLTEVENILKKHPGVKRAKVIVHEHTKYGEVLHASVEVDENYGVTEKELKNLCKNYLSRHKVPSKIKLYCSK